MKFTFLILLLFAKNCQSKDIENNTTENNKNVLIEYSEPLNGFNIKINWILKDSIADSNAIIGPAIIELQRISDNKIFKINHENFTIDDSIYSEKIYKSYKEKSVPNILQLKNCTELYFKDINFDSKDELIIKSEIFDEVMTKSFPDHKIFELTNDEFIEIKYFPVEALAWNGEIDYEKKEVIIKDYFNCCSYDASYFKFDKNSKEKFIFYKSEYHNVDGRTEDEEITIKEKGKPDVKIFKKK